jgi:hypothetical protein
VVAAAGLGVGAFGWSTGRLGYAASGGDTSPTLAYLQSMALLGVLLAWGAYVADGCPRRRWPVPVAAVAAGGLAAVFAQARSTALFWVLAMALVAVTLRPAVRRRTVVLGAGVVVATVVVGIVVATSYRQAATAPDGDPSGVAAIADRGVGGNVSYAADQLVRRLDSVPSLAVIAGRREQLAPAEVAAGIDGNVAAGVVGAVVPRAIWSSKPATSDPSGIAALYFEFPDNAFATTAMGDVLRDLGPVAVAPAMVVMGVVLTLVGALAGGRAPDVAGTALLAVLVVRIPSWLEGFYATHLAELVRIGGLAVVVLLALGWIERRGRVTAAPG